MQAKPWMAQQLAFPVFKKRGQCGGEAARHLGRRGTLAGRAVVVLVDVFIGQASQRLRRIGEASRRHPPHTNRCAEQMNVLHAAGQPFAKNMLVERIQDQALGPARRRWNHPHIAGLQAPLGQALASARPGVDLQGFFQSFSSSPIPNCVRPMRSVVLP